MDDHREAFRKHGVKRVLIAYDRDEAGDKAAAALADELMAMGIECFRVLFPKGSDANEYALKVTPAAKSLGVFINSAQWMGKGQAVELRSPGQAEPPVPQEPAAKEEKHEEPRLKCAGPAEPGSSLVAEVRGGEVFMTFGDRRYRVRAARQERRRRCDESTAVKGSSRVRHFRSSFRSLGNRGSFRYSLAVFGSIPAFAAATS